eukprot:scaffold148_cov371-Prasinococcus_capsulatus_cf.AAC.18
MVSATATKSVRGHEYVGLKVDVQRSQLEDATYMTEGGASQIFKAKYGGEVVVVKKPKLANAEDMDAYHEELKLLAGLKHPNLLPLLAARAWPPDYSFIFPYMENGSMEDLIHVREDACQLGPWRKSAKLRPRPPRFIAGAKVEANMACCSQARRRDSKRTRTLALPGCGAPRLEAWECSAGLGLAGPAVGLWPVCAGKGLGGLSAGQHLQYRRRRGKDNSRAVDQEVPREAIGWFPEAAHGQSLTAPACTVLRMRGVRLTWRENAPCRLVQ